MRINQINNTYYQKPYSSNVKSSEVKFNKSNEQLSYNNMNNINFRGKIGAFLGGTLSVITIVTTGGIALPFMSAIAAIGTATTIATGVVGGSVAENCMKKLADD